MNTTHDINYIKLTSGEIAELFNAYLNTCASKCVMSYFEAKALDPEIKSIASAALGLNNKTLKAISDIFNFSNHPIPKGFSEEDVYLDAPGLFSDRFILTYIRFMCRFGLTSYSEARASSTRADVRAFFNDALQAILELFNQADDVLLAKGIFVKEPYIPIPEAIDFVEKQSILKGFWGETRPLNASEINRLYLIYHRNALGKAFLMGLCQTLGDSKIKDYLLRGRSLSEKQMEIVGAILDKEALPVPISLDSEVTASTEPIFSARLILFLVVALNSIGLGVTGISFSRVMRRDLGLTISRFMADITLFAEDGLNIIIDKGWLERIPEAANRKELMNI